MWLHVRGRPEGQRSAPRQTACRPLRCHRPEQEALLSPGIEVCASSGCERPRDALGTATTRRHCLKLSSSHRGRLSRSPEPRRCSRPWAVAAAASAVAVTSAPSVSFSSAASSVGLGVLIAASVGVATRPLDENPPEISWIDIAPLHQFIEHCGCFGVPNVRLHAVAVDVEPLKGARQQHSTCPLLPPPGAESNAVFRRSTRSVVAQFQSAATSDHAQSLPSGRFSPRGRAPLGAAQANAARSRKRPCAKRATASTAFIGLS